MVSVVMQISFGKSFGIESPDRGDSLSTKSISHSTDSKLLIIRQIAMKNAN